MARVIWLLMFAGCARVAPYQRARLASPVMQAPIWPQVAQHDEHVYEVREGTSGATGTTGGGCGCN